MTHSGGKPHPVGDKGQRFEIRFEYAPDMEKPGEHVMGWSTTRDGAQAMADGFAQAPYIARAWVVDRQPDRQATALRWSIETFGPLAGDRTERLHRLIEEVVELAQALRIDAVDLGNVFGKIMTRVYGREPGAPDKEVGQVALCLELLAETCGISVEGECAREFARIQSIPAEVWRRRHAAKAAIGIAKGGE